MAAGSEKDLRGGLSQGFSKMFGKGLLEEIPLSLSTFFILSFILFIKYIELEWRTRDESTKKSKLYQANVRTHARTRTRAHIVKSVPWPRTRFRYPRHRLERLHPPSLDSEVKPRWWYHCSSLPSSSTFLNNSHNRTWTMD